MLDIIINTPISIDAITFETTELISNNVDVDKIAKKLGEAWVLQNEIGRIQALYNMYKLSFLSKKWLIMMKHRSNMKYLAQVLLNPISVKSKFTTYLNIGYINVIYSKCKIYIVSTNFNFHFRQLLHLSPTNLA